MLTVTFVCGIHDIPVQLGNGMYPGYYGPSSETYISGQVGYMLVVAHVHREQPTYSRGKPCRPLRCSPLVSGPVSLDDAELTVFITGDLIGAGVALDTPIVILNGLHIQHVIAGVVGAADSGCHFSVAHLGCESRQNKGECRREYQTYSMQATHAGPPGVRCYQVCIVPVSAQDASPYWILTGAKSMWARNGNS
jgi:hypothetical protein